LCAQPIGGARRPDAGPAWWASGADHTTVAGDTRRAVGGHRAPPDGTRCERPDLGDGLRRAVAAGSAARTAGAGNLY